MNRRTILAFLIIAVAGLLFAGSAAAGAARVTEDNEDLVPVVLTSADGRWQYVLVEDGAVITRYSAWPEGKLDIPDRVDGVPVTAIGDDAFTGYDLLTIVVIPEGVTRIGNDAFSGCFTLKKITLPNSVTSIGNKAFAYCMDLASITIPAGVTAIGTNPFYWCLSVSIKVSPGNPAYECVDGVLFDKRDQTLITFPAAKKGKYKIPQGTTRIGEGAFVICSRLTGLTIPDSVTDIGDEAFFSCVKLTSLSLPQSLTSIGDSVFRNCIGLTKISIPDSVTKIDFRAFRDCISLTSLVIPISVIEIGSSAFDGCDNVTLIVAENSYAEQYAKDNGIAYTIAE
jgi:hypothetical protein